ncbi:MAG: uracil-DNA glycosylase [Deltaproteobacteria bacterium]|nr:uracil-DNA glycosylase [Deltaproteobacteria bacterium]
MEEGSLTPREELREIVTQLKNLLTFDHDLGLDAPPLSEASLSYLEKGPSMAGSLETLKEAVMDCRRCRLSQSRTQPVFGEGDPRAQLVFVGEAPGKDEDLSGRPFVGEAGRLLTRIIEKGMNLKKEEVYICNVVKCRPPGNRDPQRDEIETCLPFLEKQIRLIRPKVICTLGRIAAKSLLGREFRIKAERGKWQSFMGIPLMPTFHPSYILRKPEMEKTLKGMVWSDIQAVMKRLGLEVRKNAQ